VWKASELQQALNPIINKLWAQDPEALPFRSPVDPEALGIPVSIVIIDIVFKVNMQLLVELLTVAVLPLIPCCGL